MKLKKIQLYKKILKNSNSKHHHHDYYYYYYYKNSELDLKDKIKNYKTFGKKTNENNKK